MSLFYIITLLLIIVITLATLLVRSNKMEFSKKILIFAYLGSGVVFTYAMLIQYLMMINDFHGDTGIVIALLTGAGALITSSQTLYTWKARTENTEKIKANPDYFRTDDEYDDEIV